MSLTPWNRQEEWYQQMINASTGNYLPSITAQDVGKVMTVESDLSYGLEDIPSQLPTVQTTDKDKYLHTDASTGNVEWADAPDGLPAVTDVDAGKVLTVNNSGVWVASMPSGGSSLVVTDTSGTLDKTWKEINDNAFCIIVHATNTPFGGDSSHRQLVDEVKVKDNDYSVFAGESTYVTNSETGYPILQVE